MFEIGELVALRAAFGPALVPLAERDDRIMVVTADLGSSVNISDFKNLFPDRYINCGVAEASMIGISAGLSSEGYLPFAVTFGSFIGRTIDHVRQSIGHNRLKVNIVGSHGGISNGMDGPSAHAIEDLGIMRSMPGIAIIAPSCPNQLDKVLRATCEYGGPVFLRLYREPARVFTDPTEPFNLGQVVRRKEGSDVTILACGPHVGFCLEWLPELERIASVELLEVHTLEPLDAETILKSVAHTSRVVTIEDHYVHGGLASAAAELLVAANQPALFRPVALEGYARSGPYYELRDAVGLGLGSLRKAIVEVTSP
jgi:transketolase